MGGIIDLRNVLLAIVLVAAVLLCAWLLARRKRSRRQRPGQYLQFIAPQHTAAQCRGLLGKPAEEDLFAYSLEGAKSGGWYLHLRQHRPTSQPLDTLYLLQFEGDEPARFSLSFVREAFGMREPVVGEGLIAAFLGAKLGAVRCRPAQQEEAD